MEWSEIPMFSVWGKYSCDVTWNDLENQIQNYIKEYNLNLDPDFQRGHVWSEDKRIAYVEYALKGGKHNRYIIFNHPGWFSDFKGEMTLVDGKQRLESVRRFLRDELPIFNGVYRKDFTREGKKIKRLTSELNFKFYINDLDTREKLLQFYLDLNTGGVVHTDEEISRVKELLAKEQKKKVLEKLVPLSKR